ncbi:hypothetical protein EV128_11682 [Rhizobium azibense]|nr:hypothetical protein EV128_11682 [Rhizobium azibense]
MQWVTAAQASALEGIARPEYLHVFRELVTA